MGQGEVQLTKKDMTGFITKSQCPKFIDMLNLLYRGFKCFRSKETFGQFRTKKGVSGGFLFDQKIILMSTLVFPCWVKFYRVHSDPMLYWSIISR